jgi:hypothetical protein
VVGDRGAQRRQPTRVVAGVGEQVRQVSVDQVEQRFA